ncbi:TCF3 fusion partner like protein [Myotis davidii]|uniref:TCF3 fusion partner like protein n=1 Tax=Myotis davidii TaxID=225400 RepID=L5LFL4_MYODS|nr:TCF3 fusion partner like protein [Myotis davidii]
MFLKRVLDSYSDNYGASQFTILLEDEGSQGTEAPTQATLRTSLQRKRGSPFPGGRQRPQKPAAWPWREAQWAEEIKVEEDFGFEADEALDSSWVSLGPDKMLTYPTLASPAFD